MLLRSAVSQQWLKKDSLVRRCLVTPCMVIQQINTSLGILGRQCCIPNSTPRNLGARSSQRILGSRSEHATLVVRLCARWGSPHGTGVRDGLSALRYSKHRMQKCRNMATLKRSGKWQNWLSLTENSTTRLFCFVAIYLVLKAETAVHGCLMSWWLCACVQWGLTTGWV